MAYNELKSNQLLELKTIHDLKNAGYESKTIKEELRNTDFTKESFRPESIDYLKFKKEILLCLLSPVKFARKNFLQNQAN